VTRVPFSDLTPLVGWQEVQLVSENICLLQLSSRTNGAIQSIRSADSSRFTRKIAIKVVVLVDESTLWVI